ncbi:MAG: hypothetical protein V4632_07935 [Pseudomonadota bacterium]
MFAADSQRPPKLYQHGERQILERSLSEGEFRLLPAAAENYLVLSFAATWDPASFDRIPGADCCLLIHNPEEFGERLHRAAQKMLPTWAGIDAAIAYGTPSPLGKAFSKSRQAADEKEWLFAWRPTQATTSIRPLVIRIGSIETIAELRMKDG